jgi:DNA-binding GntR family transcriptional regulator
MVGPAVPNRRPSAPSGEIIRPSRLSSLAKGSIRSRINSGEITVGKIYSVPSLAEKLGVSATPVREAMLDLVAEGLVEAVPNRGFRVIELTPRDLDEIFELRLMLEVPATAALAVKPVGTLDIEAHFRLAEAIEHHAGEGDTAGFLQADREFHLSLVGASGNVRLVELVSRLRDQARLYGVEQLARLGHLEASAREHRDIVEAIRHGDVDEVTALVTRHLRHTRGIWAGVSEAAPA